MIRELQNYIAFHFKNEEALREKAGDPALPTHCTRHQKFIAQAGKFRDALDAGRDRTDATEG